MILIEDQTNTIQNDEILKALGITEYKAAGDWTLEQCIYPRDRSVSIGRIDKAIIVCEDLQLVDSSMRSEMADYEVGLAKLNPKGEVLSVACLSSVNYHGYSLLRSGTKVRFKQVGSDSALKEEGDLLVEEIAIYDQSVEQDGKTVWPESLKANADVFEEDQLMEEFTFEMAKRILKVRIDEEEGEDLFFNVPFTRFEVTQWQIPENVEVSTVKNRTAIAVVALALVVLATVVYFIFLR